MMGYQYGFGSSMMGGAGLHGTLLLLTWVVWFVVGILAAIWLWQHISK